MTNLTARDRGIFNYKKKLLKDWYAALVSAAASGALGRDVRLTKLTGIAGPRSAAMCIEAGWRTGAVYDALSARGAAIARESIPFSFSGDPLVMMSGRACRIDAAWADDLAETDILLSDIAARPSGIGHDGAVRWTFGLEETGSTVLGEFSDAVPHWLVGGTTGSGKTESMKTLVAQLAPYGASRELEMIICDGKQGKNWREAGLDRVAGLVGPVATDIAAARAALGYAVRTMIDRYSQGSEHPPLIVIVDEIQEFATDDACTDMIDDLAARGRDAHIHLLVGTQHPTTKVLSSPKLKRNLPGRVGLRVTDPEASHVIMGNPTLRADYLKGRGHALIVADGALHNVQLARVGASELKRVPRAMPRIEEWDEFEAESISGAGWSSIDVAHAIKFAAEHPKRGRPAYIESRQSAGLPSRGTDVYRQLMAHGRQIVRDLRTLGAHICRVEDQASKEEVN